MTQRVTVYSKPKCPGCAATYRDLDNRGIEYDVVDITQDPEGLQRIKDLGYLQAPTVVVDDDNHWSGYNPEKIAEL